MMEWLVWIIASVGIALSLWMTLWALRHSRNYDDGSWEAGTAAAERELDRQEDKN